MLNDEFPKMGCMAPAGNGKPVSFCFYVTAATEIYTLSLHDALPIFTPGPLPPVVPLRGPIAPLRVATDRKSTRLNSSHVKISYAVFCLKKKILAEGAPFRFSKAGGPGPAGVHSVSSSATGSLGLPDF